jgi:hypothetical protein
MATSNTLPGLWEVPMEGSHISPPPGERKLGRDTGDVRVSQLDVHDRLTCASPAVQFAVVCAIFLLVS